MINEVKKKGGGDLKIIVFETCILYDTPSVLKQSSPWIAKRLVC